MPRSAARAADAARPTDAAGRELDAALRAIVAAAPLAGARAGIFVADVESGQVLFARDPDVLLNPASNVKLVTSAAARREGARRARARERSVRPRRPRDHRRARRAPPPHRLLRPGRRAAADHRGGADPAGEPRAGGVAADRRARALPRPDAPAPPRAARREDRRPGPHRSEEH